MTTRTLIDKASTELIQELLDATSREGVMWLPIVRRKLTALAKDLKRRKK